MSNIFKDATPTNPLVIKPSSNAVDLEKLEEKTLQKLTKNELVELAEEKIGIRATEESRGTFRRFRRGKGFRGRRRRWREREEEAGFLRRRGD